MGPMWGGTTIRRPCMRLRGGVVGRISKIRAFFTRPVPKADLARLPY